MTASSFTIANHPIGPKHPPLLIAELSGNHHRDFNEAKNLIQAAAQAGAHAVKLQTFKADTLTLPIRTPMFQVAGGLWDGQYLCDLYQNTMTPWEWHKPLADYADFLGIFLFSTPFDETGVDFLETTLTPPLYKIATAELNHIPLLRKVGQTKKPVLLSTGMAYEHEIATAIHTLKQNGCPHIIILKCISAHPAEPDGFNLRSIQRLTKVFNCPIGLSDHSLHLEIALGAVAFGACIIERHLTLSRANGGVDSAFSTEPDEFATLVQSVTTLHSALGTGQLGPARQELENKQRCFRRSIYVTHSIQKGERLSPNNIRIIRPAYGLSPTHWDAVLGKTAACNLEPGTPLAAEHVVNFERVSVSTLT